MNHTPWNRILMASVQMIFSSHGSRNPVKTRSQVKGGKGPWPQFLICHKHANCPWSRLYSQRSPVVFMVVLGSWKLPSDISPCAYNIGGEADSWYSPFRHPGRKWHRIRFSKGGKTVRYRLATRNMLRHVPVAMETP